MMVIIEATLAQTKVDQKYAHRSEEKYLQPIVKICMAWDFTNYTFVNIGKDG